MKLRLLLGFFLTLTPHLFATPSDLRWGVEALTGLRSNYLLRGLHLSHGTLEAQLDAEITLQKDLSLQLGTMLLTEVEGDFSEQGLYLELRDRRGDTAYGLTTTYRHLQESPLLESGVEVGTFLEQQWGRDWRGRLTLSYDFANEQTQVNGQLEWSQILSQKTYLALQLEGAWFSDLNSHIEDSYTSLSSRLSLTHHLNDTVSFTPFLGGRYLLNDLDGQDTFEPFAGLWMQVFF